VVSGVHVTTYTARNSHSFGLVRGTSRLRRPKLIDLDDGSVNLVIPVVPGRFSLYAFYVKEALKDKQ